MLRRLALRRARMPALASRSSEMGSIPFWLITTKPSPLLPQICGPAARQCLLAEGLHGTLAVSLFGRFCPCCDMQLPLQDCCKEHASSSSSSSRHEA